MLGLTIGLYSFNVGLMSRINHTYKMKKHLFVINPVSGGINKDDLIRTIEDQFLEDTFSIWMTTGENDPQKLKNEIKSYQPDVVVIAGGDGTINQMVLSVIEHNKELGIIPSGSANGLATDLGITMNNWLTTLRKGSSHNLDIVMINDVPMIHMADLGLNATLVKRYEEENRRGFLGYAVSAFKELPTINQEFPVKISDDGKSKDFHTSFLVIANSQRYGTGFEINPEGSVADGKFELCIMKELTLDSIFGQIFNPNNTKSDQSIFEVFQCKEAIIQLTEKVNFQIDGEYIGETDYLKVEMHHQTAKLLVP